MWDKGHRFPVERRGPIVREQLTQFAEASGDHNRIHLDESFAKEAGFSTVIVHGMISMSFIGDYLIQFFPESQYQLTLFRSRFKNITFPGDSLLCEAEVREVTADEEPEVLVHVWATNEKGDLITDGECRFTPKSQNDGSEKTAQ